MYGGAGMKCVAQPVTKKTYVLVDPTTVKAVNRLLKEHGLVVKMRGTYAEDGDQRYLRIERLESKPVEGV